MYRSITAINYGYYRMHEFQEQLRSIGLRTEARLVLIVVLHIKAGGSLYKLYERTLPIVSKRTAEKIRRLYEDGKLDFLVEGTRAEQLLERLYPFTDETQGERQSREELRVQEDEVEILEHLREARPRGLEVVRDALGNHRIEVMDRLPTVEWNIKGLERANISQPRALKLLAEFDGLNMKRRQSVVTDTDDIGKKQTWLADFPGIDRYVALHYLAEFSAAHKNAPYRLLDKAATLTAKGSLELDNRLWAAGTNIVRYEIWRGPSYLEAYLEATKSFLGSKKRRQEFEQQIRSVLQETTSTEEVQPCGGT